jgi:hypothetical protein
MEAAEEAGIETGIGAGPASPDGSRVKRRVELG